MPSPPEPAPSETLPVSQLETSGARDHTTPPAAVQLRSSEPEEVQPQAAERDAEPSDAEPSGLVSTGGERNAVEANAPAASEAVPSPAPTSADAPQTPADAPQAPADAPLAAQLICDGAMEVPEVLEVGRGSVCYFSRRCAGKATANEDAVAVIPVADCGVVIAVADGVGGLPQGDKAARITLETLAEHVGGISDPAALRSTILDAIERANRRVLAIGGGAATTLAVAQIVDGRARTYHVGDSEVLIVNGRGAVKSQTIAHAPVAYGVHSGWIDAVDALVHEHRNLVSNVIGSTEMRIEIGPPIRLALRDIVLVCSDGITDNLHAEEIGAEICGRTAQGAAQAVLESLDRRREMESGELYKEDDATLVTYRRTASTGKGIPLATAAVEMPAHQV